MINNKFFVIILIILVIIVAVFGFSFFNKKSSNKSQTVIFDIKPLFNPLENLPNGINLIALEKAAKTSFNEPNQIVNKMLIAIRKGVSVPKCENKTKCESYCRKEINYNECVKFAESSELISSKEAQMALVVGPYGPGKCYTEKECEFYCKQEENKKECVDFAYEKGLIINISEKDLKQIRKNLQQAVNYLPISVKNCLKENYGDNALDKIVLGDLIFTEEVENECLE
ncbi:MAG: hypothetical protein AAB593_00805 [Patescibacteria group bacterium]